MHRLFHFFVTGEMVASESVFERTKQVIEGVTYKYTEDPSSPQSSVGGGFQRFGWQCATLRHISTIFLGVWLEWLV
jgi:hypothetical protein